MSTLQKTTIAATIGILASAGIFEARQTTQLREQNRLIQSQNAQQIQQIQSERDNATNRLATLRENYERSTNNTTELLKLRAQVASLLQRNRELSALAESFTNSSNEVSINETDYVIPESWADAGQNSATAAVRTALWALVHGNADRLKAVLWLPTEGKEAFVEQMTQIAQLGSMPFKGARITEARQIGHDDKECLFMVEVMEESELTTESGESFGHAKTIQHPLPIIVRRFGDIWQVLLDGKRELSPEEIAQEHAEAIEREKSAAPPPQ